MFHWIGTKIWNTESTKTQIITSLHINAPLIKYLYLSLNYLKRCSIILYMATNDLLIAIYDTILLKTSVFDDFTLNKNIMFFFSRIAFTLVFSNLSNFCDFWIKFFLSRNPSQGFMKKISTSKTKIQFEPLTHNHYISHDINIR